MTFCFNTGDLAAIDIYFWWLKPDVLDKQKVTELNRLWAQHSAPLPSISCVRGRFPSERSKVIFIQSHMWLVLLKQTPQGGDAKVRSPGGRESPIRCGTLNTGTSLHTRQTAENFGANGGADLRWPPSASSTSACRQGRLWMTRKHEVKPPLVTTANHVNTKHYGD